MPFILKTIVSALTIVAVSELGKRSSLWAAILVSLPLTSILAMIWLYRDTHDVQQVAALSKGIFWMILPSLLFFILLPLLLKTGLKFWLALPLSCAGMVLAYSGYSKLLVRFGIKI